MDYRSEADIIRMTPRQRGTYLRHLETYVEGIVDLDEITEQDAHDCLEAERLCELLWALPTQFRDDAPIGYFDGSAYQYVIMQETRAKDDIKVGIYN